MCLDRSKLFVYINWFLFIKTLEVDVTIMSIFFFPQWGSRHRGIKVTCPRSQNVSIACTAYPNRARSPVYKTSLHNHYDIWPSQIQDWVYFNYKSKWKMGQLYVREDIPRWYPGGLWCILWITLNLGTSVISLRLSLIQSLQCNATLFELTRLRIEIIEKKINFDLSFFLNYCDSFSLVLVLLKLVLIKQGRARFWFNQLRRQCFIPNWSHILWFCSYSPPLEDFVLGIYDLICGQRVVFFSSGY